MKGKIKTLFYRCDNCGAVIDWYRGGFHALCKHCGEGTLLPMKELYVVNSDREKETLDETFKLFHCEGYEIAVLNICNDGPMLDDDIVFASPDRKTWDMKALKGKYKGRSEEYLRSVLEFFTMDFSSYDRVIVCHAGGIHGTLGEYVLSYKFEREGRELYRMDLTPALDIAQRPGGYCEDSHLETPLAGSFGFVVAASNPTAHVDEVGVKWAAGQWRRLLRSQMGLCIFEEKRVVSVPPTIYDELLVDASETFTNDPKELIAVSVHAKTNNVTFHFLLGRVNELVKTGRINLKKK